MLRVSIAENIVGSAVAMVPVTGAGPSVRLKKSPNLCEGATASCRT